MAVCLTWCENTEPCEERVRAGLATKVSIFWVEHRRTPQQDAFVMTHESAKTVPNFVHVVFNLSTNLLILAWHEPALPLKVLFQACGNNWSETHIQIAGSPK